MAGQQPRGTRPEARGGPSRLHHYPPAPPSPREQVAPGVVAATGTAPPAAAPGLAPRPGLQGSAGRRGPGRAGGQCPAGRGEAGSAADPERRAGDWPLPLEPGGRRTQGQKREGRGLREGTKPPEETGSEPGELGAARLPRIWKAGRREGGVEAAPRLWCPDCPVLLQLRPRQGSRPGGQHRFLGPETPLYAQSCPSKKREREKTDQTSLWAAPGLFQNRATFPLPPMWGNANRLPSLPPKESRFAQSTRPKLSSLENWPFPVFRRFVCHSRSEISVEKYCATIEPPSSHLMHPLSPLVQLPACPCSVPFFHKIRPPQKAQLLWRLALLSSYSPKRH